MKRGSNHEIYGKFRKRFSSVWRLNRKKVINRFTAEFIKDFCQADGTILWDELVQFNSASKPNKSWLRRNNFAAKLLKNPRGVQERAALETFIARKLYGLSSDDWKHLTSTFTFGSDSETKAELDEIIRQSLALWTK